MRCDTLELAQAMRRAVLAEVEPMFRAAHDPAGGFHPELEADWSVRAAKPPRRLVHAARMTWTAARLVRSGVGGSESWEEHCRHGLRALGSAFIDREHGGAFWELGADGTPSERSNGNKHVYGVCFAIYAFAEAAAALDDPGCAREADGLFYWLDEHARDTECGGYHETLDRSGRILHDTLGDDGDGICRPPRGRSTNVQLHVLEALTALAQVSSNQGVRDRLREMVDLFLTRIVSSAGHCWQCFGPSWTPHPGEGVSYGHDLETVYLLHLAHEAIGVQLDVQLASAFGAVGLRDALDTEHGGVFSEGPIPANMSDRPTPASTALERTHTDKIWWVQAEALNAFSYLYTLLGTPAYDHAMRSTWGFIDCHLLDHEHGGWRWSTDRVGTPGLVTQKANNWKTAYHTARALLETAGRLDPPRRDERTPEQPVR